ncbi:MAG: hypothetical protein HKN68_07195 [Saprospiraceae bacterium]|nr:hypothetical protein [Saprospiraceae bacterium]
MAKSKKSKAKVNPKLAGFEIQIDSLGEIKSSLEIDKINKFLDKEVEDIKLIDQKKSKPKKEG